MMETESVVQSSIALYVYGRGTCRSSFAPYISAHSAQLTAANSRVMIKGFGQSN